MTKETQTVEATNQGAVVRDNPEREMAYRLKNQIETDHKFKDKLNDMAVGYAAGSGMSVKDSRDQISDQYRKEFNVTPNEHLSSIINGNSMASGQERGKKYSISR